MVKDCFVVLAMVPPIQILRTRRNPRAWGAWLPFADLGALVAVWMRGTCKLLQVVKFGA